MHAFSFFNTISDLGTVPPPFDPAQAAERQAEWLEVARTCEDPALIAIANNEAGKALLDAIFGTSPFLTRLILRDPAFVGTLARLGPDDALNEIYGNLRTIAAESLPEAELARHLRMARAQAALTIAAADISGVWQLEQVTRALSDFAEAVLRCTVNALLRNHAASGNIELSDPADPSSRCGYIVLGMGKLGARELNYSSDIDIIVLFDPERCSYTGKRNLRDFQIRFTQTLVKLMQEFTSDGYVFRTDLRLRPDPAATPIALPVEMAETYYESVGKGWERAAMIKARPVAGDIEAGQAFLDHISPFVWRKSLDFAAIRDVNDMVGLIHAHHGHSDIVVPGHNVKLGVGGIREIEFFVQTHQLIAGGRERELRVPQTLRMLEVLRRNDRLTEPRCRELHDAYIYLRTLEHRLQMINDEQTHTLPESEEGLARIAAFMGFHKYATFEAQTRSHLDKAAAHFRELMATGLVSCDEGSGERVTMGIELPDEAGLGEMGFRDPARALETLQSWRTYRYRAFQASRARELLDHLAPTILRALSTTSDPDGALVRFDEFLSRLPAGVQVLSLFNANRWLLEVLAEIMGTAPTLAETLARNPSLLDAVLSPDFMGPMPSAAELADDLDDMLFPARDLEEVLNLTRRWANDRKFQVGVQLLQGLIDGGQAGATLSDIADVLLRAMMPRVSDDFAVKHGTIPGGAMAIVAMGKLGGRELTFTSDLDLVFIYDGEGASDGASSITAGHYFARLSQRFINAVTALTEEGRLYEIDMRLRPSGTQGPIAVSLDSFKTYQSDSAQTWEHMAWSRARAIAGPEVLQQELETEIRNAVGRKRTPAELAAEVTAMRDRIDQEFGSTNPWNFKYVRGGMMDAEFLTQFLVLQHALDHPRLINGNTVETLDILRDEQLLTNTQAGDLIAAVTLLRDAQQLVRLCLDQEFDADSAPLALRRLMAAQAGDADFDALTARLLDCEARVHMLYQELVGKNASDGAVRST